MIKHDNFGAKALDFTPNKHKRKPFIGSHVLLFIILLFVLVPFYILTITSLESEIEANNAAFSWWPKMGLTLDAYKSVLFKKMGGTSVVKGLWNTIWIYVPGLVVGLLMSAMSAFSFAKLRFRGKNFMFSVLLATMMIPGELFTITNYQTIFMLGWQNTYTVLIVPFLVSVFYIYLLRQNFLQIPNELYLAAKVDGTSDFKYLWKVMVPLSLPTLISITILKMMGAWNSYVWPRLVANDDAHKLITNGLRNAFNSSTGETNYPVQMAAVAMVSFPLFLVFIFLRKYIMSGVSRSGIKG